MAVNDLDAKTRAVEKMKAEPGKEYEAYQAAENQLLAIRAEQKQNLAMERLEGAAAQQQNAMIGQVAELVGSSGGGVAVQAPVNAATQNVLAKYGAGPTITKTQSQRSTQQVTKQNITINNYNTTTNIANNQPQQQGAGPLQGRPVVVDNRDTGRFKVWVSNVLASQNEQAAIRDREYQRRESILTRSANKMTRKLEAISSSISSALDPRRTRSDLENQIRTVMRLIGIGFIATKWPTMLNIVGNLEKRVRDFATFMGIGKKDGEESGFLKSFKYLLLGDDAEDFKGGFLDTIKEAFTDDKKGILSVLREKIALWWDNRFKAIQGIDAPKFSYKDLGGSMKNIVTYLGQIVSVLLESPSKATKGAEITADKAIKEESKKSVDQNLSMMYDTKQGNIDGKSTSKGDYLMETKKGIGDTTLVSSDITDNGNKLQNNVGASIRQSGNIVAELGKGGGELNVLNIAKGLDRLVKTAEEASGNYVTVHSDFLKILQSKLGISTEGLGKEKRFKYVSVPKSEYERNVEMGKNEALSADVGSAVTMMTGNGMDWTRGLLSGKLNKEGADAKRFTHKLLSEDNIIKLVDAADPNYEKYRSLNRELGVGENGNNTIGLTVLTLDDLKTLEKRIAEKVNNPDFTLGSNDISSMYQLGEMITNAYKDNDRITVSNTYNKFQKSGYKEALEYEAKWKALSGKSYSSGLSERATNLRREHLGDSVGEWFSSLTNPIEESGTGTIAQISPKNIIRKGEWDVNRAINTIKKNAKSSSTGYCLRHVGNAISAGFNGSDSIVGYHTGSDPNMGGISSAKYAGSALARLGFEIVPNDSIPQQGDIRVFQAGKGHADGHIELFDGTNWYSDFKQKTSGKNWGYYPLDTMRVYRWKGFDGDIIDDQVDVAEADNIAPPMVLKSSQNEMNPEISLISQNSTTNLPNSIDPRNIARSMAKQPTKSTNDKTEAVLTAILSSAEEIKGVCTLIAASSAGTYDKLDTTTKEVAAGFANQQKQQSVPMPTVTPSYTWAPTGNT